MATVPDLRPIWRAAATLLLAAVAVVLLRRDDAQERSLERIPETPPPLPNTRRPETVSGLTSLPTTSLRAVQDLDDFSSNLPLVVIDTAGEWPDWTREWTDATLSIYAPDASGRARIGGKQHFSGSAGFRHRGRSSTSLWPKKQFAIELRDEHGEDRDVSILGMPAESDWILLGPYSDKSLIRNVLAYRWSRAIGRYAARTRLVELFLSLHGGEVRSDDYHGVYVLLEKPKRGADRVALARLDPAVTSEPDISGGYLLRKDWGESDLFVTQRGLELEYREPKSRDITPAQARWIRDYVDRFERALFGAEFADPGTGYARYIDVDSFVDHFLLVELTKNGDAYYHSTFLHKDRGRKLEMGPIWDYNLALGNFGRGELSSPAGWYWPYRSDTGTHEWYARLLDDPRFGSRVLERWSALRKARFSEERLVADIDELSERLAEAQERNFERWPVLGEYVRYNDEGWDERDSYETEIEFLRDWLRKRLRWLDDAMPQLSSRRR